MTHRNPNRLFPAVHLGLKKKSYIDRSMDKGGVQTAFKIALQDSNIHKKATVHTLRHSYATHMVEAGVNLRLIQEFLGHASPNTTVIYAHLSKPSLDNSSDLIDQLMDRFQFKQQEKFFFDDDE